MYPLKTLGLISLVVASSIAIAQQTPSNMGLLTCTLVPSEGEARQLWFQAYFNRRGGTIRRYNPRKPSPPARQANSGLDGFGLWRNESRSGRPGTTVLKSTGRAWQTCWANKPSDHVAARDFPRCR